MYTEDLKLHSLGGDRNVPPEFPNFAIFEGIFAFKVALEYLHRGVGGGGVAFSRNHHGTI